MTVSPKIDLSNAMSRIEDMKRQFESLRAEVEDAGNDPEEVTLLDRLAVKIEEAAAKACGPDVSPDTGGGDAPASPDTGGGDAPGVLPPVEPVAGTWSIRAIVKDPDGANAAGAEVRLTGPSSMSMTTDNSGVALFDVQKPGRYMVQAITEHSESDPVFVEEDSPEEGKVVDAELQVIGAPDDFNAPTEEEEPTIRNGDEDADGWVEYLQKLLNKHLTEAGEPKISVSGTFDSATDGAVRWFQGYTKCQVDGIVGNQTWSSLREDHERKEIGTDERPAGTHSEQGAEGRWLLEANRMAVYDEGTDSMSFTIASVGTEPLKGFRADIFFGDTRTQATIGDPTESSAGQDMHTVTITRVGERFGKANEPVEIKAYLPQELGGDLWDNKVDIAPNGAQNANWEILVTVKDQNGNPLEEAGVDFNGPAGQSASTDASGQASHGVTGPSRYQITAEFNGERSQTEVVDNPEPEEGEIREVELVVNVVTEVNDWSITAIVKDQNGDPIENAGVEFDGPIGLSGVTDADGVVNHGVSGPGTYNITATIDGKSSPSQTVEETEPEDGEVREVELVIELDTQPGVDWSITAIVQDKEGNPIKDAGVDFNGPIGFSGVTDDAGSVNHGVQGPGRYEVTATFDGKTSTKEIVEETAPEDSEVREVVLVIDHCVTPEVDWSITAIVKDQNGNPLENAGVNFDGPVGLSGVTDGSGIVNHGVQGPGRYEISATYGGETSTKEIVEETGPEDGEVREVELIIDTTDCNDTPWSITVIVKDQDGGLIKDAGVNFDGPIGFSGTTDASGSVNHGVNGPGRYELSAEFMGKASGKEVVEEVEPTEGDLHEIELTIDISDVVVTPWSINAIVKNQNGEPIENAGVNFDGPIGFSGTTDSSGLVSHGVQGPGRYELTAEFDGKSSTKEIVEETDPEDSEVREVELIIEVETCTDTPWSINAIVKDQNGNPLENAGVNFDGPVGFSGTTDGNGLVSHGVQGPGRYVILAELDGKSSGKEVVEELEPSDSEVHEVELTIDVGDGPVVVEPVDWSILARVKDQDGNAIADAGVSFDGPMGFSGTSDGSGEVTHSVTGPGRYVVSAEFEGQTSRTLVVEETTPDAGETREVEFIIDTGCLNAEWSIVATVKDHEGNALKDAAVNFDGPMGFSGTTDSSGLVTHTVEGAGRYVLTAEFDGKESGKQVVEETAPDSGETHEIDLVVDLSDTPPVIVEDAPWSIKAIVKDQDGNPIPDAAVSFDGPGGVSITSDSSGEATHDAEGEARYVIEASIDGKQSPKEVVEEITPDEGEVREVELIINMASVDDNAWSIIAIVNDQDGNPVSGADVDFNGPIGFSGSTDGSGKVTHEVQGPGRYELTATHHGNTSAKQAIEEIEPQEGDSHEVVLVIEVATEPVEVVKWVIDATVKDHEGNPINNAAVGFDGPVAFTGMTDAAGRVSHEVQGPGRYTLKAIYGAEQSDAQTVNETDPTEGEVHEVDLTIDLSSVEPPDPVCEVTWIIDAQVNDQNGEPVANAAVDFDGPIGFTGITDSSGRVSHEAVGPSSYTLKAITVEGVESDTQVVEETTPEQGEVREITLVVQVEETEEEDGDPLLADVEIEIGNDIYGSITVIFDSSGKFAGIDLKRVLAEQGLRGGADGLIAGGKVELAGVLEGRMTGNKLTLSSVLAASGSVMVGLGVASPKAWLGLGVEFGLKFARTIETLTIDFDKSVLENAANAIKQGLPQPTIEAVFDLPATYTLSAKFSAIFGGGSGSILEGKISKTLADYPEMLIIELSAANGNFDINVTGYPGVLEFANDVAHFTAPGTMMVVDELMEIADDPEGYVEERRDQVEEAVERVRDLPDEVQEHFGGTIKKLRDLL